MFIHSRDNVPDIYTTSRDFQAILRLLDIITNVEKNDINNTVSLVNADKCPSKYLPLLASFVGYDYDYSLSYETNRLIIKYYPLMIKYRGSEKGIRLACAVAINSALEKDDISGDMDYLNVIYDSTNNILNVFVGANVLTKKLYELIEVVRPVGMAIQIKQSVNIRPKETLKLGDYVTVSKLDFSVNNRNKVMPMSDPDDDINMVGFGEVNEQQP